MIEDGSVERNQNDPDTAFIVNKKDKTVIALKWQGQKRAWLVTAYPRYDSFQSPDSNTPLSQTHLSEQNPSLNSGSTEGKVISDNNEGKPEQADPEKRVKRRRQGKLVRPNRIQASRVRWVC